MSSSPRSSKPSSKTRLNVGEPLRLNRYLADCGLGSRRKAEQLVLDGKVSINGSVCTDLGVRVDPTRDEVLVDGVAVQPRREFMYLMLNKPRGYVVSQSDELGRQTVYDLIPEGARHLVYAGRLDRNSEGLLLMTDDTAMINGLTHPTFKVEKVYKVVTTGKLTRSQIDDLRKGVKIDGGVTRPAGVFVNEEYEGGMTLKIVISEGRKRQIRQMLEAVGGKVRSLRRLQFGPLMLKDLGLGQWRPLTPGEIRALKATISKGKNKA